MNAITNGVYNLLYEKNTKLEQVLNYIENRQSKKVRFIASLNIDKNGSNFYITSYFDRILFIDNPDEISRRRMCYDLLSIEIRHNFYRPDDEELLSEQPWLILRGKIGNHHTVSSHQWKQLSKLTRDFTPYHLVALFRCVHTHFMMKYFGRLYQLRDVMADDIFALSPLQFMDFHQHIENLKTLTTLDEIEFNFEDTFI